MRDGDRAVTLVKTPEFALTGGLYSHDMKYWMFQSNQVVGPYDREELAEEGGFSAESLVCPEGRKGTQMGDWQRAGVVAELAEVLLRKAKVPAGSTGSAAMDPGASLIPPEPTLRDLAVLGTLQEKVSLLENSLSQMQDELRQREEEITGLKVQLDEKGQEASQLGEKVTGLESKLESTEGGLKEEIGKTKDDVAHENELIEGLKGQLDTVRSDIQESLSKLEESQGKLRDELKDEVGDLKLKAGSAPLAAPATGAPDLSPQSAGADLDLPNVMPSMDDEPLAGPAGETLDSPAMEGAGALGELPPPPGEAGSLEEVPPPSLEGGDELPPPPSDFPSLDSGELPPPPGDLPAPDGELPPPPGMEMAGGEVALEGPPMMDAGDPPPVTLEAPPALGLAPAPDGGIPSLDPMATPALEPLDTPVPGMGTELPITQTGGAPEPLVPPPSMATPDLGGVVDMSSDADLVDLSASGAAETAEKKKGGFFRKLFRMIMILILLVAIVGGLLFQGYKMGMIQPYLKHPSVKPVLAKIKPIIMPHLKTLGILPKKATAVATLKDPQETAVATANEPEEQMPVPEEMGDRTQDSIEFAKNWPVGTNGKTLAMVLESGASSRRRLEPWNAERLGEGRFQVNFYSKPGSTPDYQFEVLLDAGQIRGLTTKSKNALEGKLQAAPPVRRAPRKSRTSSRRRRGGGSRRKGKRKPRVELTDDGGLTDPLGSMLMDSSLGDRAPIQKETPKADEPEPVSKKKKRPSRRRARKKAPEPAVEESDPFADDDESDSGKSGEELTLDELLLPGVSQ